MTKKQKYLGLFAILPLLIVTLSSGAIGEAMAEESASVEMTSINQEGDRAYDVSFSIYAGDEALPDGKLLVTSDSQSKEVLFRGVSAGLAAGSGQVRITAEDPGSLSVQIQDIVNEVDILTSNKWARQK